MKSGDNPCILMLHVTCVRSRDNSSTWTNQIMYADYYKRSASGANCWSRACHVRIYHEIVAECPNQLCWSFSWTLYNLYVLHTEHHHAPLCLREKETYVVHKPTFVHICTKPADVFKKKTLPTLFSSRAQLHFCKNSPRAQPKDVQNYFGLFQQWLYFIKNYQTIIKHLNQKPSRTDSQNSALFGSPVSVPGQVSVDPGFSLDLGQILSDNYSSWNLVSFSVRQPEIGSSLD
jgi:hypothetical protein